MELLGKTEAVMSRRIILRSSTLMAESDHPTSLEIIAAPDDKLYSWACSEAIYGEPGVDN